MPTSAVCGTSTGPLPWRPGAAMEQSPAGVSSTTAATPVVPVAVAARLQALLRRGKPDRCDAAGMEQTPTQQPFAVQQVSTDEQQQQHLAGGSNHANGTAPPSAAGAASQLPAAPSDVLARLQQLRARQAAVETPPNQQVALAAAVPPAGAHQQAGSSTQQPGAAAADLAGPSNSSQEGHQLQQPHDYVAALRQLLARQQQQQQQQQDPAAAGGKGGEEQHCHPGADVEDMEEDYWGDGSSADPGPLASHSHLEQAAHAEPGDYDMPGMQGLAAHTAAAAAGPESMGPCSQQQQQQLQEGESPMSEDGVAHDGATSALTQRLLALAGRCLTAGDMVEATQHAQRAQQMAAAPAQQREAVQLLALCHVLQHAGAQQWQQLLSWAPGVQSSTAAGSGADGTSHASATAAGVGATTTTTTSSLGQYKQQYKRLAALVHPDKCSHPAAEAAFKALQQALQQMQQQLRSMDPDHDQQPSGGGDVSGDDASWWAEWDAEVAAEGQQQQRQPTSEPREEDCQQEQELWSVSLPSLQQEVAQRQRSVLQPRTAEEAALPAVARQKRLRVARSVLAVRLRQQQAEGDADEGAEEEGTGPGWWDGAAAGGFLR